MIFSLLVLLFKKHIGEGYTLKIAKAINLSPGDNTTHVMFQGPKKFFVKGDY
jgi:copper(I)-binding protein